MGTEALKSAPITSFDATPAVRPKGPGYPGAIGKACIVDAYVLATHNKDTGSTYRMVRLPSNAFVKRVWACLESAVTTFTADIGVYYDTSSARAASLSGTVIDADLFADAVALAAIVVPTQYTMESTQYGVQETMMPLWQAAGLSANPGGMIDVVLTLTATSNDGNSGADGIGVYLLIEFVQPGA